MNAAVHAALHAGHGFSVISLDAGSFFHKWVDGLISGHHTGVARLLRSQLLRRLP